MFDASTVRRATAPVPRLRPCADTRPAKKVAVTAMMVLFAALLAAPPVSAQDAALDAAVAFEPVSRIAAAAESQARSQLQHLALKATVQAGQVDPRLRLRACAQPLSTAAFTGPAGARVTVRVSCPAPSTPWAVFVPVSIESEVEVLTLRRSEPGGARLAAQDVAVETRRIAGLPAAYVTDVTVLPHYTLARSLPAGTALTVDVMQADYLIRQGQAVTLVVAGDGIEVRAPARALEDGREGSRVHAQNLASQKVVQGVVDRSGVIYVTP